MRIYGAGILSSKGASVYCLDDDAPNRIAFDLLRVMRTNYRIDDFQATYFVIDSFAQLFGETAPDFTPIYALLTPMADLQPGAVRPQDSHLHRGTPTGTHPRRERWF